MEMTMNVNNALNVIRAALVLAKYKLDKDLSGAILRNADLSYADLRGAITKT